MTATALYEEYLSSPWSEPSRRERESLDVGEPLMVTTPYGEAKGRRWPAAGTSRGTVLLAHGWAGRSATWLVLVPLLNAAGYDALAFDAPGHGETRGPEGPARSHFFAFVATLLAAGSARAGGTGVPPVELSSASQVGPTGGDSSLTGGTPVPPWPVLPLPAPFRAVIGHSFGACAIPYALARGLNAERAVLIAPTARTVDFLVRWATVRGLTPEEEAGVRRLWLAEFGADVVHETDPVVRSREMTVPALVLHDAGDAEVPIRDGRLLAEAWPGARFEETNGVGHRRILLSRTAMARVVAFVDESG